VGVAGPLHFGLMSNIGPRQARRRQIVCLVSAVAAAALLAGLLLTGVDRAWRLLLFLPLIGATLGFFQHRERT
jgi:fatty acid desaturase